jgi:acyl-CoA thioesterase
VGSFAEDIVVSASGAGRYAATLDHSWDLVRYPQGGIVVGFALRAAETELAQPGQVLRTCTTIFAGAVEAGELEITVEVLRRGRTASQVRAEIRNAGASSGATVVAVYGGPRQGPTFIDVVPPSVAPPADGRSYREPPPDLPEWVRPPFWERVEGRQVLGHAPWEEFESPASDVASWYRFDQPPRLEDGSLDPLGLIVLADRMPSSIAERLGNQGPRWFAPSADLTVHLLEPSRSEWVLIHDHARWADDGWASIETTLWDESLVPVAYATQMVLFTYL